MVIQRKGYFALDECYDEYCLTMCPIKKGIYIGSMICHACENFIKEERNMNLSCIVECKE